MKPGGSLRIAELTEQYQAFLWEIMYYAIFLPPGHAPLPRSVIQEPNIRRYVENWSSHDTDFGLAALEGEDPIGAIWLRLLKSPDRGYGWVDDDTPELAMAVLPPYRGQGIGTRLLQQLISDLGAKYSAISLNVDKLNPAVRLYQRMGFKDWSSTGDSITMLRRTAD